MCLNVAHVQADTNMKNSPGWCCEKMKKFARDLWTVISEKREKFDQVLTPTTRRRCRAYIYGLMGHYMLSIRIFHS